MTKEKFIDKYQLWVDPIELESDLNSVMEEYTSIKQDELIEKIMNRMEEWVILGVIDTITVDTFKRIKKIFKSLK